MRHARRGAIYIYVLTSSALVTVIGLGAVYATRVHRQHASLEASALRATRATDVGLDAAQRWIETDQWPPNSTSAPWASDLSAGGDATVEVTLDPSVPDRPTDPVGVRLAGRSGDTITRERARLTSGRPMSGLEAAMVVGGTLTVNGGQLTSALPISAHDCVALDASVDAPIEVISTWSGSAFGADVTRLDAAREIPDASTLIEQYAQRGVIISLDETTKILPSEPINNSPTSGLVAPWEAVDARVFAGLGELADDGDARHFRVQDRQAPGAGLRQEIALRWDDTAGVRIACSARMQTRDEQLVARLTVQTADGDEHTFVRTLGTVSFIMETVLETTIDATWSSSVVGATLSFETAETSQVFLIDNVSLQQIRVEPPTLADTVLAPGVGEPGMVSPNGIWVIECAGESVVVESCRIIGTLVLLEPGPETVVRGAMLIEPNTTNAPSLLSNGSISLQLDRPVLSELSAARTLNPVGAPWPVSGGATDEDLDDAYAARISGLVMVDGDVRLDGTPTFRAPVIVTGDVRLEDARVWLRADGTVASAPPAGFDPFLPDVRFVRGSREPVLASDW